PLRRRIAATSNQKLFQLPRPFCGTKNKASRKHPAVFGIQCRVVNPIFQPEMDQAEEVHHARHGNPGKKECRPFLPRVELQPRDEEKVRLHHAQQEKRREKSGRDIRNAETVCQTETRKQETTQNVKATEQ